MEREWLNGPRFVEWLYGHGLPRPKHDGHYVGERSLTGTLGESWARRVYEWRHGGTADFYTAVQIMDLLNLVEADIPDHLWTSDPRARRDVRARARLGERRERGRRLLLAGARNIEVATKVGVAPRTVVNWRNGLRREGLL